MTVALVLIIEDHAANLKLARLILECAGHEVLGAESAAERMGMAGTAAVCGGARERQHRCAADR